MTPLAEYAELLGAAFPVNRETREGYCAWCGRPRKREHALCNRCWRGLWPLERQRYMALDLEQRARWILERKKETA